MQTESLHRYHALNRRRVLLVAGMLAVALLAVVADLMTGRAPAIDPAPFDSRRFA